MLLSIPLVSVISKMVQHVVPEGTALSLFLQGWPHRLWGKLIFGCSISVFCPVCSIFCCRNSVLAVLFEIQVEGELEPDSYNHTPHMKVHKYFCNKFFNLVFVITKWRFLLCSKTFMIPLPSNPKRQSESIFIVKSIPLFLRPKARWPLLPPNGKIQWPVSGHLKCLFLFWSVRNHFVSHSRSYTAVVQCVMCGGHTHTQGDTKLSSHI